MNSILYKYLPPERTGFFKDNSGKTIPGIFPNLELVAVSPSFLNDPFECANNITIDKKLYLKRLYKSAKRQKHMYSKLLEKDATFSKSKFKEEMDAVYLKELNDPNWVECNLPELRYEFEEKYKDFVRIMSLSKNKSSLLMWSHYTKEHKGFVVGIDRKYRLSPKNPSSQKVIWETVDVKYLDDMPLLRLELPFENTLSIAPFRVKSTCWSYESEVRNVAVFGEDVPDDKGIAVCSMPPNLICEITLGARMDDSQKNQIIEYCKANEELHHVKIFQAKLSKTHFKLEFDSIDYLSH